MYLFIKWAVFGVYGYLMGHYFIVAFPERNFVMLAILLAFVFVTSVAMGPWYDVVAGKLGFGPWATNDDEKY